MGPNETSKLLHGKGNHKQDEKTALRMGENWTATCKRMKLEHSLIPYTKINSKWIRDLNVRPDTIKILEENLGGKLLDISHFGFDTKSKGSKTKIKCVYIKLKRFCTEKKTISKMKWQIGRAHV